MSPAHLLAALLFAPSFVGVLYTLLAARAARRFFAPNPTPPASHQAVSLLKPLHGAEPNLAANLATFLAQTHAGPLQMVLGVNAPDDSALPPAQILAASHPNIAISTGPRLPGSNGKIGNLRAMLQGIEAGIMQPPPQDPRDPGAGERLPVEWGAAIDRFAEEARALLGRRPLVLLTGGAVDQDEDTARLAEVSLPLAQARC